MFRVNIKWVITLVFGVLLLGSTQSYAQANGENLFKANCASCHQLFKDGTGPKLYGVKQKWEDNGAGEHLNQWIRNWKVAAAENAYANSVSQWSPTAMKVFGSLTEEDATAIIDWIDVQEPKKDTVVDAGDPTEVVETEADLSWIWYILGIVFFVIIFSVGGVRRQLKTASGEVNAENLSYGQEFRGWAWKYRKYVGIGTLVIVFAILVTLFLSLYEINVMTSYQPSQPIDFPHSKHAGLNGIDCKYCHNSVDKSKSAGLPTVNVCMNCHKQVTGNNDEQMAKIQKIYDAAGFDPTVPGGGAYSGETEPIVWNKVHNLPDHVYFNHSQHVVVGGVDCKQCHGDMTKQTEVAQVKTAEELSAIDGNIKMTKPTLTMGWCIECHDNKEIASGPLANKDQNPEKHGYYDEIHDRLLNNDRSLYEGYLEDNKVTVKELGGWECAKCHY